MSPEEAKLKYDKIISFARSQERKKVKGGTYYERHHILPRKMGGTNEIITTFSTIADAEKVTGIPHSSISNCYRGGMKLARGFKWKYVNSLSRFSLRRLAHRIMKQLNITNYKVEVHLK